MFINSPLFPDFRKWVTLLCSWARCFLSHCLSPPRNILLITWVLANCQGEIRNACRSRGEGGGEGASDGLTSHLSRWSNKTTLGTCRVYLPCPFSGSHVDLLTASERALLIFCDTAYCKTENRIRYIRNR